MSAFDEFEVCRDILESLPVGLCVVDLQKRVVFWSDGAECITGRLRHEVVGRSCIAEALLHCWQTGCEFCGEGCALAQSIKTARNAEASGFLHHKYGYKVPVRVCAVPVHGPRGSIIGAVEIFENLEAGEINHTGKAAAGCIDEVTGVASQEQMKSQLQRALAALTEKQTAFAVLRLRLQGLEHFRAAFGPDAESSLLCVVARSLASNLWKTDSVGRWCNDEFLVILNGCGGESLASVRERLRRLLTDDSIEWWGEQRSLPVSIGEATAQTGDTIETILDRSQESLDHAAEWLSRATTAREDESSES